MAMMHNVSARLNSPFFFGTTLLGILAALSALSVFVISQSGQGVISNIQVNRLIQNKNNHWDEAQVSFDLELDMSQVWNWNVKLLFIWVEADYANPADTRNQIIVWDKIVWRNQYNPSQGVLSFKGVKGKYWMRSKGYDLQGTKVTFRVRWEVVPIVGINYKMDGNEVPVTFPSEYK